MYPLIQVEMKKIIKRRFCKKCGELFIITSRYCKVCDKCCEISHNNNIKLLRERNERRKKENEFIKKKETGK